MFSEVVRPLKKTRNSVTHHKRFRTKVADCHIRDSMDLRGRGNRTKDQETKVTIGHNTMIDDIKEKLKIGTTQH